MPAELQDEEAIGQGSGSAAGSTASEPLVDVFNSSGQRGKIPLSQLDRAFISREYKFAVQQGNEWKPIQPVRVTDPHGDPGWVPSHVAGKALASGYTIGQAMPHTAGDRVVTDPTTGERRFIPVGTDTELERMMGHGMPTEDEMAGRISPPSPTAGTAEEGPSFGSTLKNVAKEALTGIRKTVFYKPSEGERPSGFPVPVEAAAQGMIQSGVQATEQAKKKQYGRAAVSGAAALNPFAGPVVSQVNQLEAEGKGKEATQRGIINAALLAVGTKFPGKSGKVTGDIAGELKPPIAPGETSSAADVTATAATPRRTYPAAPPEPPLTAEPVPATLTHAGAVPIPIPDGGPPVMMPRLVGEESPLGMRGTIQTKLKSTGVGKKQFAKVEAAQDAALDEVARRILDARTNGTMSESATLAESAGKVADHFDAVAAQSRSIWSAVDSSISNRAPEVIHQLADVAADGAQRAMELDGKYPPRGPLEVAPSTRQQVGYDFAKSGLMSHGAAGASVEEISRGTNYFMLGRDGQPRLSHIDAVPGKNEVLLAVKTAGENKGAITVQAGDRSLLTTEARNSTYFANFGRPHPTAEADIAASIETQAKQVAKKATTDARMLNRANALKEKNWRTAFEQNYRGVYGEERLARMAEDRARKGMPPEPEPILDPEAVGRAAAEQVRQRSKDAQTANVPKAPAAAGTPSQDINTVRTHMLKVRDRLVPGSDGWREVTQALNQLDARQRTALLMGKTKTAHAAEVATRTADMDRAASAVLQVGDAFSTSRADGATNADMLLGKLRELQKEGELSRAMGSNESAQALIDATTILRDAQATPIGKPSGILGRYATHAAAGMGLHFLLGQGHYGATYLGAAALASLSENALVRLMTRPEGASLVSRLSRAKSAIEAAPVVQRIIDISNTPVNPEVAAMLKDLAPLVKAAGPSGVLLSSPHQNGRTGGNGLKSPVGPGAGSGAGPTVQPPTPPAGMSPMPTPTPLPTPSPSPRAQLPSMEGMTTPEKVSRIMLLVKQGEIDPGVARTKLQRLVGSSGLRVVRMPRDPRLA